MSTLSKLALMALVAAPALVAADAPGYFNVPGTDTKIKFTGTAIVNGAIEVHGGTVGTWHNNNFFPNPGEVALDNAKTRTNQMGIYVWDSNFGMEAISPSKYGDIKAVLLVDGGGQRTDNMSHHGNLRMKKAYGQLSDWLLVGLEQSLFFSGADVNALVGCTDSLGGSRAPQIRFISKLGANKLSFSLEDTNVAKGLDNAWNTFSVVGRLDIPVGVTTFNARAVTTQYKNENTTVFGYGLAGGATFKFGEDALFVDVAGGRAMGDFMWAMTKSKYPQVFNGVKQYANPDSNVVGDPTYYTWRSAGITVGYDHAWNAEFTSTLFGSYVRIGDNREFHSARNKEVVFVKNHNDSKAVKDGKAADGKATKAIEVPTDYNEFNKEVASLGVNTTWKLSKTFSLGGELNYNFRKTFGGQSGKEMNLGFQASYKFF